MKGKLITVKKHTLVIRQYLVTQLSVFRSISRDILELLNKTFSIKKFETLFWVEFDVFNFEKYLFENFPAMNIYQMNYSYSFPWNCSTVFIRRPLQYVVCQCRQLLSRPVASGGGGALDPQFLADHLTLAQPGGTLFPQAPRIFRPSDGSDYALLIQ